MQKQITSGPSIAAWMAVVFAICLASPAFAHGRPSMGGGPSNAAGPVIGVPGVARPDDDTFQNPNGTPTIGRPAGPPPDTDRGRSEGKGQTDLATHGAPAVGKVASFHGSTLTLTLPNGATKTFIVDPHALGQMKPRVGDTVAVQSDNGMHAVSVTPAEQTLYGHVMSVSRQTVTLRLPNGTTRTIVVASQAASKMRLSPGVPVTVISHDGGASVVAIRRDGKRS